ncbi:MAG: SPOR domain-containing protein [Thermodesulfobacteriota bacterium]|nr:SPOR domain-containing protein [Thermodesulfobacteriota bacterium]
MKHRKPNKRSEGQGKRKRFRFELGPGQILALASGAVAALAWMFLCGILVGRGLPPPSTDRTPLAARLYAFLGLDRHDDPTPENAADTWEDPQEILQSLQYHEALTQPPKLTQPVPHEPSAPAEQRPASDEPPGESPVLAEPPPTSIEEKAGNYTLMAASFKHPNNAENLVRRLQDKGYAPRMETVHTGSGELWHRVLVGSFETREQAQAFAARFNREENLEGLVIRLER